MSLISAPKRFAAYDFQKKMAYMLIGTSGSGKTATCFEIGRCHYVLYFDVFDSDLMWYLNTVKNCKKDGNDLETFCREMYMRLVGARYFLLSKLFDAMKSDKTPWKWFSYQRSKSFQNGVCELIQTSLTFSNLPKNSNIVAIIFDEAHVLLNVLQNRFPNSTQIPNSRPLLSLLIRINYHILQISHIYAGTHLSLKDETLFVSGAGGGKESVTVFTDFDFYTPDMIKLLLEHVLSQNAFQDLLNHPTILNRCCTMLQGRVRFFATFVTKLTATSKMTFLQHFTDTLENYINSMTLDNDVSSLYSFWKKNLKETAHNIKGKYQNVLVYDGLVELLINHYFQQEKNSIPFPIDLVDSALTKLCFKSETYEYSMDEPLALKAGLNFLCSLPNNPLAEKIISKMFGDITCSAQHFGNLFEILLAIQCLKPWWRGIPDALWGELPLEVIEYLHQLDPPIMILNQDRIKYQDVDWALLNFQTDTPNYFVLPDNNLGPDGIYDIMCFNCKTTKGKNVTSAECDKNYKFTNLDAWAGNNSERRFSFKNSTQGKHLIFFQIEFPYPNPKNARKMETYKDRTIIPINLDSSITKYIFPEPFLLLWKKYLETF
jgi:hypothetical protein